MSTPPSPGSRGTSALTESSPGVIEFTGRGEAALDTLVAELTSRYDGTPESITKILDHVLGADVEDLAEGMSEVARASGLATGDTFSLDQGVLDLDLSAIEGPSEAACRRLGSDQHRSIPVGSPPADPGIAR